MKQTTHELRTDNHMSFRETGKDRQREIEQAREGFKRHTSLQAIEQAILRQNGGAK